MQRPESHIAPSTTHRGPKGIPPFQHGPIQPAREPRRHFRYNSWSNDKIESDNSGCLEYCQTMNACSTIARPASRGLVHHPPRQDAKTPARIESTIRTPCALRSITAAQQNSHRGSGWAGSENIRRKHRTTPRHEHPHRGWEQRKPQCLGELAPGDLRCAVEIASLMSSMQLAQTRHH